jgi:hypothetical protein
MGHTSQNAGLTAIPGWLVTAGNFKPSQNIESTGVSMITFENNYLSGRENPGQQSFGRLCHCEFNVPWYSK